MRIFRKFDQNLDSSKILTKSRFSKTVIKIEIFRKSSPKIEIFKGVLTKFAIFVKFGQNPDIWKMFHFNQDFSKILTKIEIVGYYDQNRDVSIKIEIYRRFWPNLKFSPILTKLLFFETFVQNWDFIIFWPKSRYFEKLHQNRDF